MNSTKVFQLNDVAMMRLEIERLSALVSELSEKLYQQGSSQPNKSKYDKGILVYENKVNKLIKYEDLIMIKSESNYSILFLRNGSSMLTSKTLKYWEERCNANFLKRVHKSYIINFKMIKSIVFKTKSIQLEDGHTAVYSRSCKNIISELKQAKIKVL
jgi:two-component system LytT family response regulator